MELPMVDSLRLYFSFVHVIFVINFTINGYAF